MSDSVRSILLSEPDVQKRTAIVDALEETLNKLRNAPLDFGDPLYRTRKEGGVVCHGLCWPMSVQFVVYEAEQVVCILKVKRVPT